MVRAPNGSEDLIDKTEVRAEDNLSTRSMLQARLLQLDEVPVVEFEDEQRTFTITADGDPSLAAVQLERAAATLLAAAHRLQHRRPGHHTVMVRLGQHQFIPWCSCGQSHGVVS